MTQPGGAAGSQSGRVKEGLGSYSSEGKGRGISCLPPHGALKSAAVSPKWPPAQILPVMKLPDFLGLKRPHKDMKPQKLK